MKLYLDTNVLRDCLKRRNLETLRLLEIIRGKNLECVTSIFSLMELMDTEKDDFFFNDNLKKGLEISKILRNRSTRNIKLEDLNSTWDGINSLFVAYPFVQFINLVDIGWNMSLEICRICNLDADDSIHLASAIGSGCDVFVTSDTFLIKEGLELIKGHNASSESGKNISLQIISPKKALEIVIQDSEHISQPLKGVIEGEITNPD